MPARLHCVPGVATFATVTRTDDSDSADAPTSDVASHVTSDVNCGGDSSGDRPGATAGNGTRSKISLVASG